MKKPSVLIHPDYRDKGLGTLCPMRILDYLSTKLGTDYLKAVYLKQTDDAEDADEMASSFEEFKERSASELRFDVMPYRGFFQEIDIGDLSSLRDALSRHKYRSVEPYYQCTVKVVFPPSKENPEFRRRTRQSRC